MLLDGVRIRPLVNGQQQDFMSLSTSWKSSAGTLTNVRAVPEVVLVPLYHKIRIPFSTVQDAIILFDRFLEALRSHGLLPWSQRVELDVYLTDVNALKHDLTHSTMLHNGARRDALLWDLPRFLWRATAYCDVKPVLDLLVDATDIEQGPFVAQAIEYDPAVSSVLRSIVSVPTVRTAFQSSPVWKILEWFNPPASP